VYIKDNDAMHLITIRSGVCERVNAGQTSQTLFRSFARRNMAITEISVADSITRGYYYVDGWICASAVCARALGLAIVFV